MEDAAKAIDNSVVVIMAITTGFLVNVAGKGPGGANNTCRRLFHHATQRKVAEYIIPVVLEEKWSEHKVKEKQYIYI